MFDTVLSKVHSSVKAVDLSLKTNELIRNSINEPLFQDQKFSPMRELASNLSDFRKLDHCLGIIRLYGIYENAVGELLSEYLIFLSSKNKYQDLSENIKEAHRKGLGQILLNLEKYPDQKEISLVSIYNDCLNNKTGYNLLTEAMLFHDRNLRFETLCELFSRCGLNVNNWLTWYPLFNSIEEGTINAWLKEFVTFRNDAAHGDLNLILSSDVLQRYCEIVALLCEALREYLVKEYLKIINPINVGKIENVLKNGKVGIFKPIVNDVDLSIGKEIFLVTKKRVINLKIESLQVNDISQDSLKTSIGTGIGIGSIKDFVNNSSILVIRENPETQETS